MTPATIGAQVQVQGYGNTNAQRHDWPAMQTGEPVERIRGVHYLCPTVSMMRQAYKRAKQDGYECEVIMFLHREDGGEAVTVRMWREEDEA